MSWAGRHLRSVAVGRRFLPQLAEHRGPLIAVGLASLTVAGLEILRPWPLQWIFDGALVPTGPRELSPVAIVAWSVGALLLISVTRALVEYFGAVRSAVVGHQVTRSLRYRVFAHLTDLPPSFHARNKSGDLMVRLMGDVPMLRTMLVDSSVALLSRLVLILGMLVVMFRVDALLTFLALAVLPGLFLVVRSLSGRITTAVRKQRKKEGAMADYLHEAVAGVVTIQSLGRGPEAVRRFARDNRTSARAGLKATRLAARLSATVESLLGVVTAGTLGVGSWRVLEGQLSPGELLVFLSYVRGLLKPVRAASRHSERIARGTACGERILTVLDAPVTVFSAPDAPFAPEAPDSLAFHDVSYRYAESRPVLAGFNASFERGTPTCLFGLSGAGKSTVGMLALRLADPQAGQVRLGGHDLRDLDLASVRARFGLCLQETTLFGDTVRENLLLGDPQADDERLRDALRAAAADGFVGQLPDGLDTVLDTAGGGLSGGQRQRLALARTLLRRPAVLLVDEPFSGLDRAAVQRVRDTLIEASEHAVVLVICHEVEHLEVFDRIVFLHEGRVRDTGSHAELLARCPAYQQVLGQAARELVS